MIKVYDKKPDCYYSPTSYNESLKIKGCKKANLLGYQMEMRSLNFKVITI